MNQYRLGIEIPKLIGEKKMNVWNHLLLSKKEIEYVFLHFEMGDDPQEMFQDYQYAKQNGYKIGIITDLQSGDKNNAKKEAEILLSSLDSIKLDLPIFLKIVGRALDPFDRTDVSNVLLSFCKTIEDNSPYKCGICVGEFWYYNRIDFHILYGYDIWFDCPNAEYKDGQGIIYNMDISAYGYIAHLFDRDQNEFVDISMIQFYKDYFPKNPYRIMHWYVVNKFDNTTEYRYFDTPDHYISNDWIVQNGKWFYFDQLGFMVKDVWYCYNNKWYYIDKNGILHKNHIEYDNNIHNSMTYNSALKYHGLLKGLI